MLGRVSTGEKLQSVIDQSQVNKQTSVSEQEVCDGLLQQIEENEQFRFLEESSHVHSCEGLQVLCGSVRQYVQCVWSWC